MRQPERLALKARAGAAGEIHFDGDGFVLDDASQATELIEHGGKGMGEVAIIRGAAGDGNGSRWRFLGTGQRSGRH